MLVIKCIEKIRDSKGRITHYKIQDTKGNTKIVTANQLKVAITNMQVNCINLTLTSDNRLIDKEAKEVKEANDKINKEELDREKIRHKNLIAKLSLLGNKLGDTTYRIRNAIYEIVDNKIYLKEALVEDGEFEIPEFVSGFYKETIENRLGYKRIISHAFKNCRHLNLKNRSSITDMSYLFSECKKIESIDMSEFDASKVVNMSYMFNHCASLTSLNISNFDTSKVVNMSYMFNECSSLKSLNIPHLDTSKVVDMSGMFLRCENLETLDISHLDTSNVTDMSSMFSRCPNLKSLNISHFDTSKVTDMHYMFAGCSSLKSLNLSHFDTSKVKFMYNMFSDCYNLVELDLSNFDTSNVEIIAFMFSYCHELKSLNISGFSIDTIKNKKEALMGIFDSDRSLREVYASETAAKILINLPKPQNIEIIQVRYKK